MMGIPSAVWLDTTTSLKGNYSLAATTLASAANHTNPPLVVFIVYNLPVSEKLLVTFALELKLPDSATFLMTDRAPTHPLCPTSHPLEP